MFAFFDTQSWNVKTILQKLDIKLYVSIEVYFTILYHSRHIHGKNLNWNIVFEMKTSLPMLLFSLPWNDESNFPQVIYLPVLFVENYSFFHELTHNLWCRNIVWYNVFLIINGSDLVPHWGQRLAIEMTGNYMWYMRCVWLVFHVIRLPNMWKALWVESLMYWRNSCPVVILHQKLTEVGDPVNCCWILSQIQVFCMSYNVVPRYKVFPVTCLMEI